MNLPSILLWGLAATIVLTTLSIAAQSLGSTYRTWARLFTDDALRHGRIIWGVTRGPPISC